MNRFIFSILLCMLAVPVMADENQDSGYQEAASFVLDKLSSEFISDMNGDGKILITYTYSNMGFSKKSWKFSLKSSMYASHVDRTTITNSDFSLNPALLNVSVSVERLNNPYLLFTCLKSACINVSRNGEKTIEKSFELPVNNRDIANRLQKAFEDMIIMSGGKKSKY